MPFLPINQMHKGDKTTVRRFKNDTLVYILVSPDVALNRSKHRYI